jgi:hypothetical protein
MAVSGGIDPFEADTIENEDNTDLTSLLFPPLSFASSNLTSDSSISTSLNNYLHYSFAYNNKLFRGWVKQPSPCCAAASLAGALNALGNLPRSHPNSLTHLDILHVYEKILMRTIEKKKNSFERCLGGKIDELLELLQIEISSSQSESNETLKKRKGIGKLMLVKLLKKIVNKKLGTREISDEAVPQKEMPSTYELFAELLASEETSQTEVLIRVSSS